MSCGFWTARSSLELDQQLLAQGQHSAGGDRQVTLSMEVHLERDCWVTAVRTLNPAGRQLGVVSLLSLWKLVLGSSCLGESVHSEKDA